MVRAYAVAVLLLTCWAGYTAVAYVFRAVFTPVQIPERFVSWTKAVDADRIHHHPADDGISRAPLSRYHQIEGALPRDATNGCLTSGCHTPLPHAKRPEVRAFANLHVTFMDCEVCHTTPNERPDKLEWIDLASGGEQKPPAHLRLRSLLQTESARIESEPRKLHRDVLDLLDGVIEQSAQAERLQFIRLTLDTSPPGSPVWHNAIESLRAELPYHARGDYGAKLSRDVPSGTRAGALELLQKKANSWLELPAGDKRRDELYDEIHARIIPQPGACFECHGGDPPRVNFESLGYPADRAAELRNSIIAQQMQHIRDGRPFYLPGVLEDRDAQ